MDSLFSIDLIICTYNNAGLLKKTLAAITYLKIPPQTDWGLLVVNNNCTDKTTSVVEQYVAESTMQIRSVIEPVQGLTAARICGVNNTERTWVAFIDDDCILADNWLEEAKQFITAHPQCGMFGSRITLMFEKEPPPYVHNFPFAYAGKNHGNSAKRLDAVAGLGMVVLREALELCGWTKTQLLADRTGGQLTSGGDMEIAFRVRAHYEIWYNPDCKIDHIIPEQRTTKKYLRRMLFGLGASRHNVVALSWNGPYITWLPYSVLYLFGMLGMGVANALKEVIGKSTGSGLSLAVSPFFGWGAAMKAMMAMKPQMRKIRLGYNKGHLNRRT